MACKLYYKHGKEDYYLGEFRDQKKAESHWELVKAMLQSKLGTCLIPIYVETGKGRGK